jgi:hypothetical protein
LNSDSLVVELASNDGYLLSEFKQLDVPILGVEPAENVAKIARQAGVNTLIDFFGAKLARSIRSEYGYPRLIVANNVFAHIPDMRDFMHGLAELSDANTVITIENPSFCVLMENTLFDTIYHEHYSYISAHSVRTVARSYGLDLFRVEKLSTHGGSNRYWLGRSSPIDKTVQETLESEIHAGLFDQAVWDAFAGRTSTAIENLRSWLNERRANGNIVAGYGAAHKGNTFLNAVGEAAKSIIYVVDASPEKQGKFLPGSQIPVLAPEYLASGQPTDVLILPWNIAEELSERIRLLAPKARIWVAQPALKQL